MMRFFVYASLRSRSTNRPARWMAPPAVIAAVLMCILVGCGKRSGDRGALYPAEGQVFVNQEPLAGALVVLYPKGEANAKAAPSRGQAGPDGRFRVGTFAADDGAPQGEYAVTVVRYPTQKQGDGGYAAGRNDLPKKYASPTTTDLRVQIGEGKKSLPPLVLLNPKDKSKGFNRTSISTE
jgi:hypothetical protein